MIRNRLLRKQVFERDGGRCCRCHRYDPKWQADHIVALWSGGKDVLDNLQTLCRHCHLTKSVGETPVRAKSDRIRDRHALMLARRKIGVEP